MKEYRQQKYQKKKKLWNHLTTTSSSLDMAQTRSLFLVTETLIYFPKDFYADSESELLYHVKFSTYSNLKVMQYDNENATIFILIFLNLQMI